MRGMLLLLHKNHSKEYWNQFRTMMLDYEKRKDWLRGWMSEDTNGNEKFIEILLVVMSLTLAGSKGDENQLFYFALFAFLIFAILTRAYMAVGFVNARNVSSSLLYLVASFATAISFPSVLVPFFFSKLSSNLEDGQKAVIFVACALIAVAVAALIFMVLANGLFTFVCSLTVVKEKKELYEYIQILYFILMFMLILVISLILWHFFQIDIIKPLGYAIQYVMNEGWILEGLFVLVAALVGGLFTLFAVKYEERMKREHQRKCIATAFYYEIKELEKIITPLLDGFISWGYEKGKRQVGSDNILKDIITKQKLDLKYKSLYSESGVYYQFLKEVYVLDDDKIVKDILEFYSNLIAADRCYKIYDSHYGVAPDKNIDWNTALTIQDDLAEYLFKLKELISSLDSSDLKNHINTKNDTPIPESTLTTTHTSEKDAEQ